MSALAPRRAFLRGLLTLPLVGGAVELLGNPRAVALEADNQLMFEYGQWLSWERVAAYRALNGGWGNWADQEAGSLEYHAAFAVAQQLFAERDEQGRCYRYAPPDTYQGKSAGLRSHAHRWHHGAPSASTRAALVLSAVGCDWRGPYR